MKSGEPILCVQQHQKDGPSEFAQYVAKSGTGCCMENLRRRETLCLYVLIGRTAILLVCDCHFNVWKARSFQNIGHLKQNSSPLQESLSFSFPLLGGAIRCLSAGRRLEQWSEKQGQVMGFSGRWWPPSVDTQINPWSFCLLDHCLCSTRRQWWKQRNKIRKLVFCQHKELFSY